MSETNAERKNFIELRPGIFQIYNIKPGSHVYLLKGTDKNVLIDSGIVGNYPVLKEYLNQVGLRPEDITMMLLTHEHMDHAGAAGYFAKSAIIAAHRNAANKIELQDEFVTLQAFENWRAGSIKVDLWLEDGNCIDLGNYQLQVVHTPGHSSGCICLYEPSQRLLFSGDTVFGGGTLSNIGPSGNISDYMHSIKRLNTLRIDELYPGHGKVSKEPEQDMKKALGYAMSLFEDSKLLFQTLAAGKQKKL
ncbi:MAG: MBL fold metallo-hydrolase [Chloroflexi bacterium]|nr:MBL fold metallo-hydrolase [Chloroflexota bacterium]MBM3165886.1 MBL fold metallo-hydrolase [Chloroflexota bacterium]MBM3173263.1 MBL fold metallo-hydrolase [Chloroflexota bacterium]MBM4449252.1 MBL fold metallo-hydrolase [Chloroflexota bacterium]